MTSPDPSSSAAAAEKRPYTLVAELTYRCPLACVYCSNPTDFDRHRPELETSEWLDVITAAEALVQRYASTPSHVIEAEVLSFLGALQDRALLARDGQP